MTPVSARIFVVEDSGIVAQDIERRLQALGHQVCGRAASCAEAIEAVHATRPELVLMDIMLRGAGDGIEAATVIRDRLHIPVVFLTASSDAATLLRAREAGPYGYLTKPVDDGELQRTVEIALRLHALERERDLLREALSRAERAATLGALAQGLAHEVRNPAFAITASCDALEAQALVPPGRLDVVRRQVERLVRLMDALVEFATPGGTPTGCVALGRLLSEVRRLTETLARQRGVAVEYVAGPAVVLLQLDEIRGTQALAHVVQNAIQHSPAGSRVVVAAEVVGDGVALVVDDEGPGFADDGDPFVPFGSGRRGTLGLGLPTARRVLEDHGGQIEVGARPGGGARVRLHVRRAGLEEESG